MSLKEQIMADVKSAMKNKDQGRLDTLRFIHSAIKNKEIDSRPNELTEQDVMAVLKTMAKQRKESIEQYEKGNRQDLAEIEKFQLSIIESYLPQQMSREQVEAIVSEVITSMNATSMKQMGAVMKEVLAKTGGAADNKTVSEVVKAKLQ